MKIELVHYAYGKYGEHVVAIKVPGGNRRLFDAIKLFANDSSLKEYERVKDETAAWAEEFVNRVNGGTTHSDELEGLLAETMQLLEEAALGDSGDPEQDAYEMDLFTRVKAAVSPARLPVRFFEPKVPPFQQSPFTDLTVQVDSISGFLPKGFCVVSCLGREWAGPLKAIPSSFKDTGATVHVWLCVDDYRELKTGKVA